MGTPTSRNTLIDEGMDATNKLFNSFVKTHRLRTFLSREDLEDMKQECLIEMIKVIDDKFDAKKGFKLATYLTPRLVGFMKDYIGSIIKRREPDNETAVELFAAKIKSVVDLPRDQVSLEVDRLELTNNQVENLMLDLSQYEDGYEIVEALTSLPDACLTVILGYYILDQSIHELSEQYGLSHDAGWLYQVKRDGIETLKQILRDKGVL